MNEAQLFAAGVALQIFPMGQETLRPAVQMMATIIFSQIIGHSVELEPTIGNSIAKSPNDGGWSG